MDKLIPTILSFPSSPTISDPEYGKQLRALYETLSRQNPPAYAAKPNDTDALDLLDYNKNSLGVLMIISARLSLDKNDIQNLWPRVVEFLAKFDYRQVQIAKEHFRRVIDTFLMLCDASSKPILAVRPLKNAILRMQRPGPPTTFTWLHYPFVKFCLDSRCFREALTILDVDIEEFPLAKDKEVGYYEHLTYHLYGAMIYMGVKNWERAAEFLTYVVTCPGNAVSAVQVDAMKKLILVNLLLEGKSHHFPSITSSIASRAYKALVRPYETFAAAYSSGDADILRRETTSVLESFRQDGNEGLLNQCLENFRSFRISSLTHTYSTLGVEQIAERDYYVQQSDAKGAAGKLSSEKLEGFILGMIDRGEIRASLSHHRRPDSAEGTDCMVLFHDIAASEAQKLHSLERQIARTDRITSQAQAMDRKLCLSKEWIVHVSKAARSGSGGGAGGGGGGSLGNILRDVGVDDDDAGIGPLPRFGGGGGGGGSYDVEDEMMRNDFDDDM